MGIACKRWLCIVTAPYIGFFCSCAFSVPSPRGGGRAPQTTVPRGERMGVSHWCLRGEGLSVISRVSLVCMMQLLSPVGSVSESSTDP